MIMHYLYLDAESESKAYMQEEVNAGLNVGKNVVLTNFQGSC